MRKENKTVKAVCSEELKALETLKDYLYEEEFKRIYEDLVKQARYITSEYETYDEVYAQNLRYAKYAKERGHNFTICHWRCITVKNPIIRRRRA